MLYIFMASKEVIGNHQFDGLYYSYIIVAYFPIFLSSFSGLTFSFFGPFLQQAQRSDDNHGITNDSKTNISIIWEILIQR